MGKVHIVGIGPGGEEYLIPLARKAIADADTLIGAPRLLAPFANSGKRTIEMKGNIDDVLDYMSRNFGHENIAVLLSGDPCFFSLLDRILARMDSADLEIVPGISSFQVAFSRMGRPWEGYSFASVHGRSLNSILAKAQEGNPMVIFTGGENTPDRTAAFLKEKGLPDRKVQVAGNLSYNDEYVEESTLYSLADGDCGRTEGKLELLIMDNAVEEDRRAKGVLRDEWFEREGKVPMSKEATRAMVCSLLWPLEGKTVMEIGSGTGAVTAELARRIGPGKIYSIEKEERALLKSAENIGRAGLSGRVDLVGGTAPEAMKGLPDADRIVIGGHGGNLEAILSEGWKKLLPEGRILVTANVPANANAALDTLAGFGTEPNIWHMNNSVGRRIGGNWMLKAQNPVFLVWADKEKTDE